MSKEIKFNIKLLVDGKEQMVSATTSVRDLQAAANGAKDRMTRLRETLLSFNQGVEAMKNVAECVSEISASLNQYASTAAKVSQLTGLTGDALNKMQADAQAVADTFGEDFNGVIQAANSLAKSFGMSAEEAMQMVKDGMASGANANGEFIDTLKEYPRYFKEAGISAEAFIAITANAATQGIFSDKGVDAIKEGNLRIREMTTATAAALDGIGISSQEVQAQLQAGATTTFEVMQRVAEKLKELPESSSAVGTAIADIFGGPGEDAGLEYLKSLADINLSLDDLKAHADESTLALINQMEAQADVNETMNKFKSFVAGADAATGGMISILGAVANQAAVVGTALLTLTMTIQKLNLATVASKVAIAAQTVALKTLKAVSLLWRAVANFVATGNFTISTSAIAAAGACTALKMAIRGLMCATVVGAVIAALGVAIEALVNYFSDGEEAADGFNESLSETEKSAKAAEAAFKDTYGRTLSDLQTKYTKLQASWKALQTTGEKNKWIRDNAAAFKELGLSINSISDAENALVKNTAQAVEAFKKRAEAAAYTSELETLYQDIHHRENSLDSREKHSWSLREGKYYTPKTQAEVEAINQGQANMIDDYKATYGEQYRISGNWASIGKPHYLNKYDARALDAATGGFIEDGTWAREQKNAIAQSRQRISVITGKLTNLSTSTTNDGGGSGDGSGSGSGGSTPAPLTFNANAKTADELQNNIRYLTQQRDATAETAEAYADANKKIAEQEAKLKALRGEADKVELIPEDQVKSIRDCEHNISVLRDRQKDVTSTAEWQTLQTQIDGYNKKIEDISQTLTSDLKPADLEHLNTLEQLDAALSYYQDKQSKASLDEIGNIQETINAINRKRAAYELAAELPNMQREATDLQKGGRKSAKKLGYEGATDKIKELQGKLEMPNIGDAQKNELQNLISIYEDLRKKAAYSFDTLKQGWNGVKGISSGITSITDALESNGTAWEKMQSIIDGVISIYESFSSVIKIIEMLTAATQVQTQVKEQETNTTNVNSAATATNIGLKAVETSASITNTSVKSEEAIVEATESGAKLPFPYNIAAIAAGVAAVVGALAMIGSFSTGGIVGGGSPSGDKLIARVNSGEMILNRRQQQRMLDILNGASYGTRLTASRITPQTPQVQLNTDGLRSLLYTSADRVGYVEVRMKGRELRGVSKREERVRSRS